MAGPTAVLEPGVLPSVPENKDRNGIIDYDIQLPPSLL